MSAAEAAEGSSERVFSGREIISRDPKTGVEIGRVPIAVADDVRRAVERARAARSAWAARSIAERARVLLHARRIALDRLDEIAQLIARESGKPLPEAIAMDLVPSLDLLRYFAHHAERLLRDEPISIGHYALLGRKSHIAYRPLGTIGIISPWNFPWSIPVGQVATALVAGNAVILKPSELTPLTGLAIGRLFAQAGLPEGVLQIVTGDGTTGAALVASGVDKIIFTGSVETGRRVAETAARHLTPVVLELGGKDAMIVLADADLDKAAAAAVWGAFANAGQACASVERCYVHESIAAEFLRRVVEETARLKVGADDGSDLGAMSSEKQLKVVEEHVRDALARGARLLVGGRRLDRGAGLFYAPTVLANVDHSMLVMREETFGPVLPVMTFRTEEEAIELANDSAYGLTASIWTRDVNRGRALAGELCVGTVMINEVLYTHAIAQAPWGGVRRSGWGRTHGRLGLLEMVAPQHVHANRLTLLRDPWWYKYSPQAQQLFRRLARHFTDGSLSGLVRAMPSLAKRWWEMRRDPSGRESGSNSTAP